MAITTTAAVIGGASVVSGLMGASAAENAKDAQVAASAAALAENKRQYNQTRADLAPWRETGSQAVMELAGILGLSGYRTPEEQAYTKFLATKPGEAPKAKKADKEFLQGVEDKKNQKNLATYNKSLADWQAEADKLKSASETSLVNYDPAAANQAKLESQPGYQFRLDSQEQALERRQAAQGMSQLTPGAAKELTQYSQNFASNEWGNYLNTLMSAAGYGQGAANTTAQAGANAANTNANLQVGIGSAQAEAYQNSASAINNAVQGGISNYMTMSMYDKLLAGGGGTGTVPTMVA